MQVANQTEIIGKVPSKWMDLLIRMIYLNQKLRETSILIQFQSYKQNNPLTVKPKISDLIR